jgi:chitinase
MYERRKGFFGKAFWFVMSVTAVVSVTGTGCAVPGDGPSPPKIVATPRFSPPSGSYSSDQTVIVDCSTDGAVIHYTTDGTDPTEISSEYDIPIPVSGHGTSMTIKAMALKTGWEASSIITATYTINYLRVSTPQFDPAPGTYTADQEVSIDCATEEAVIHYTTDGTEPDASSPEYTGPVTVAGHGTTMTPRS